MGKHVKFKCSRLSTSEIFYRTEKSRKTAYVSLKIVETGKKSIFTFQSMKRE